MHSTDGAHRKEIPDWRAGPRQAVQRSNEIGPKIRQQQAQRVLQLGAQMSGFIIQSPFSCDTPVQSVPLTFLPPLTFLMAHPTPR